MNSYVFNKLTEISYALSPQRTGRCFHLSAIMHRNRIKSIGINNYNKTHPRTKHLPYVNGRGERYEVKIHSELAAVIKLGEEDCSDYYMVNIRLDMNNRLANSLCCSGCEHLIRMLNFKTLYYTNNQGCFEEYCL